MLLKILKVSSQDIYGFDFEDNKVPKYLIETNGVAKISVKEWTSFDEHLNILIFFFYSSWQIN